MQGIHIWEFAAGLGLFLFGMFYLESSLRSLAGRSFKLFLRRHTNNPVKAILGGALVTGVLQSSSVVSLIILAFTGAGIVSMRNALAVILGSNLGTTVTSWIVAVFGFKLDIESFSFPLLAFAGLLIALAPSKSAVRNYAILLLGFGLLFLGLSYLKSSVSDFVTQVDLVPFTSLPLIAFLGLGILLTAIIQSSSATVAITLSALHAGGISTMQAVAIVLGAEVGTTLKLLLGIAGSGQKAQAAVGNLLFNTGTMLGGFILLRPLLFLVSEVLKITDPLITVVFIHSFMNFTGILVLLPFLKPYTSFLQRLMPERKTSYSTYLHRVKPDVPEAAIPAMKQEALEFVLMAIRYNAGILGINQPAFAASENHHAGRAGKDQLYEVLKNTEGEAAAFYAGLLTGKLNASEAQTAPASMQVMRNAMYSSKSIKDIARDLSDLRESSDPEKFGFYNRFVHGQEQVYRKFQALTESSEEEKPMIYQKLKDMCASLYEETVRNLYTRRPGNVLPIELATLLNVTRELNSSNKAMTEALFITFSGQDRNVRSQEE